MSTSRFTDITLPRWWQNRLPPSLVPYAQLARWDRPVGAYLLWLPCLWGLSLYHVTSQTPLSQWGGTLIWPALLMFFGAFIMRSAGCIINDLWDQDLDKQVTRTQDRPLARGSLTQAQALKWLALHGFVGFVIALMMPRHILFLGLCALPIVVVYPLAKRLTRWPQLVLGAVFGWGAVIGFTYHSMPLLISPATWLCYASVILWIFSYDTIYAHMDKRDDLTQGIKSSAISFGDYNRLWLVMTYGLVHFLMGCVIYAIPSLGVLSYLALLGSFGFMTWLLLRHWRMDDPHHCLYLFKANIPWGLAWCVVWIIDGYSHLT